MAKVHLPEDLTQDEYDSLDRKTLVRRCLDYQVAYTSLINTISLYKRQLSVAGNHALQNSLIADLARELNTADLGVITKSAIGGVPAYYDASYATLYLLDRDTRLLTLHACSDENVSCPALHFDNDQDILLVHFMRYHRDPMLIQNIAHYETTAKMEFSLLETDLVLNQGAILCPLYVGVTAEPQPVGILVVADRRGGFFGQHDLDSATMFSEMLATSIHSAQLLAKMSRLAETDGLTELYNHRHFQQELNRAISSSRRYQTPLSLAMVDIDKFKVFNDTHGHQAGDLVMREVSRVLRSAVRDEVDILARYGGEEFSVIMPQTSLEGASIVAERIRSLIAGSRLALGGESVSVTVSIGLGQYVLGSNKSALIEAADEALYQAKSNGRNRVAATPFVPPAEKS